jgi:uncharacterized ferredoxin-like protein
MKNVATSEKNAISGCARFMVAAARTAPKTRGIDNIVTCVVDAKKDIRDLVLTMRAIAKRDNRPSIERDAGTIESLHAIVLLGVRRNPAGLNCGFCGHSTCEELKSSGGMCAVNLIDLGIAVGSAVSVASQFHIDNRIMHSIGRAAIEIGIFEKGVRQVLGIPLSVSGKSPFFDRK